MIPARFYKCLVTCRIAEDPAAMSVSYDDGEVVWVKWNNFWWPGEVWHESRVPKNVKASLHRPVIHFIKFFLEEEL